MYLLKFIGLIQSVVGQAKLEPKWIESGATVNLAVPSAELAAIVEAESK